MDTPLVHWCGADGRPACGAADGVVERARFAAVTCRDCQAHAARAQLDHLRSASPIRPVRRGLSVRVRIVRPTDGDP